MQVIIAEKPSVAKNIADALNIRNRRDGYFEGVDYLITWAFGHLLQLYDSKDYDESLAIWKLDNFPYIPEEFKYKIKSDVKNRDKADSGAKAQLKIIKDLINRKDVVSVVSACDFDREGQIIGDIILDYLNVNKPIKRLLLNEWTADEVLNGLKKLKPNSDLKPVSDAGICRQWADWTIGINLTSVATLQYKKGSKGPLNIGRVLLPTLKIIYDRDEEINKFVSKNYFKLNAIFSNKDGKTYDGIYYEDKQDKFNDKKDLQNIKSIAENSKATVSNKDTERKKEYAPYLFNLSNLQGHITSKYSGWTSDKVLKVAQSLYESKYITYPRTASIALEESLVDRTQKVLEVLKRGLPYEKEVVFTKNPRVFDNKKVEGHSAIIPTYLIPNKLTKDQEIVYSEIKDRFIMQFMPVSEYDETTIETVINDNSVKGIFVTKGKIVKIEGWKKVQGVNTKEVVLPDVSIKEVVNVDDIKISSHKTNPPPYHTEKTLLRVMETCGKGYDEGDSDESIMNAVLNGFSIGTPATRADTINKLKTAGYIETKGKSLTCSNLGKVLVEKFPIKELFDLEYTGRLEKTLLDVEKGKVSKNHFLKFIFEFTEKSVDEIKRKGGIVLSNNSENVEVLGLCPKCGAGVVENSKSFGCSDWKNGCNFNIWKNDRFLASMKKEPTKEMVQSILKDGKVEIYDLVSQKGNKFNALLSYSENKDSGYYNWTIEEFINKK